MTTTIRGEVWGPWRRYEDGVYTRFAVSVAVRNEAGRDQLVEVYVWRPRNSRPAVMPEDGAAVVVRGHAPSTPVAYDDRRCVRAFRALTMLHVVGDSHAA